MSKQREQQTVPQAGRTLSRGTRFGIAGVVIVALLGVTYTLFAKRASADEIVVYKSVACDCCEKWAQHLRGAGFRVTVHELADVTPIKKKYGVPTSTYTCHTALVRGYVIEGHVPADLVQRLLKEQPAIVGLAVPGMPVGSPGMEGAQKERYEVLAFTRSGELSPFAVR
jgi:hypothetical protein